MDAGANRLQAAQQIQVVRERQIGMQAVDHVDFGEWLARALAQLVEHLLERHQVRVGIARLEARKRAEQARRHADVGGFEAQIEVVVRQRAVAPLALAIGKPAQGVQIRRFKQPHAVVERQALTRIKFVGDAGKAGRGQSRTHAIILSRILCRLTDSPGGPREVGANPTRCRHCQRGVGVFSLLVRQRVIPATGCTAATGALGVLGRCKRQR